MALVRELPPLEAAGVLFGVLYLVLAIRESLWCWPAAFMSSVLTIVVMFGARLNSWWPARRREPLRAQLRSWWRPAPRPVRRRAPSWWRQARRQAQRRKRAAD